MLIRTDAGSGAKTKTPSAITPAAAVALAVAAACLIVAAGVWTTLAIHTARSSLGQSGPGAMHGNPSAAAPYWRHQSLADDCVEEATADVVGELTGHEPSEQAMADLAASTPSGVRVGMIYVPATSPANAHGTDVRDIPALLQRYAINASFTASSIAPSTGMPTGIEALEQYLDRGHRVIARVNGETVRGEPGNRGRADHVVVVIGVDTARGVVHVNDSYAAAGRDEQVPIDQFIAAWDTGDDGMIITTGTNG